MAKRKASASPLMEQYLDIKRQHPEGILFFQCGDFYEMFFDDAVKAAELLDIALTSRNKNAEEPIPMAGVPHHAARNYIARLTELGQKVVLCDQVGDPKLAKGLVDREVARIVTPGVVLDEEVLDPRTGRYLAAIVAGKKSANFGLAYLDVSTGEFRCTELDSGDALVGELCRVSPSEILVGPAPKLDDLDGLDGPLAAVRNRYPGASYSAISPRPGAACETLVTSALADDLAGLGLADKPLATRAAAEVIAYARETQPAGNLPLSRLQVYESGEAMVLCEVAVANLELVATLIGGKKDGSLLAVIDATKTAPGGRLLRRWLLYPLAEVAPIRRRQDAVEYLVENAVLRAELRTQLRRVYDLERLAGRVVLGVATPRDLGRLRDSLAALPEIAALVTPGPAEGATSLTPLAPLAPLPELLAFDGAMLAHMAEIQSLLASALVDTPPPAVKDGGFIKAGYCTVVDTQRRLASGGKEAIAAIEARERERTGIPSLKVKYNKVFGYYIEVTKTHLSRVPDDYVRKQTIATAERYATGELSELEVQVAAAQDNLLAREREILAELCAAVEDAAGAISACGHTLATVDACAALAEIAHSRDYVRPVVDASDVIDIEGGRHPVVELAAADGAFVPNDCRLEPADRQILLITGPNMAGKSTYMRQVAQIVILAQMGSFVPAARARIGLVDRIFTRVGAADNLARGESTFMVEMRETAAILRGATRRSLVVLDEVGRGTSTFDGVSIAWAVTEYMHDAIGARTLFATHYHELCMLAENRPRVHNVSVAVREHGGEIVFLRQVVPGGSNRSYGIDVARLAGLPRSVIARSRQILGKLEGASSLGQSSQLSLFAAMGAAAAQTPTEPPMDREMDGDIAARLRQIDAERLTPIEALTLLAKLCDMAGNLGN